MATRVSTAGGITLLACFALPLYAPPAAAPLIPPAYDAGLLARLFPGVPSWWVLVRLACLVAGSMLLAGVAAVPFRERGECQAPPVAGAVRLGAGLAGVAAAGLLLAAASVAEHLVRWQQMAFIAALAVPVVLAATSEGGRGPVRPRGEQDTPPWAAVAAVVIGWLMIRARDVRSPRAADLVDAWQGFECPLRAADHGFNLLTDGCYGGYTALPIVVQGVGLLGDALPSSAATIQIVHLSWMAVVASALAAVAAATTGRRSAPIAAAVFLFAPFIQRVPLMMSADFVFVVYTTAMLFAFFVVAPGRPSTACLVLGLTAGIALRAPALYLLVPLALAAIATIARRSPVPATSLVAAATLLLAVAWPALPDLDTVRTLFASYGSGSGGWSALEAALFGQIAPGPAEGVIGATRTGPLDVAAGLLASPFATPRTAARLWGDSLLDPVGTALAGVGLLVAVSSWRRHRDAAVLLLVLVATLLPGLPSSYDRPSLPRVVASAAPLALLAAAGFEALMRGPGAGIGAAARAAMPWIVALVIAAGGWLLFDVVNPGILARSSLGIALDAVGRLDGEPAAVLDRSLWDPRYTELVVAEIAPANLRVLDPRDLERAPDSARDDDLGRRDADDLHWLFWSPGQEGEDAVSARVCRRWPDATLFAVPDSAGLSLAFAAALVGDPPASNAGWQRYGCDQRLPTEETRGDDALADARELTRGGNRTAAVALLDARARGTFHHPRLFKTLARLELMADGGPHDPRAARYWAWRACRGSREADAEACFLVAEAHAAAGEYDAAVAASSGPRATTRRLGDDRLGARIDHAVAAWGLSRSVAEADAR